MINIRRANCEESNVLTNIANNSEAYWGFDSEYMEMFKSIYKVSEEFINHNPTYIMVDNEEYIGFYSIIISDNETSLEFFYIEPRFIGKGYGKVLWNHMVESCNKLGIKEIEIVTSPEAKGFYTKMGAVQTWEVESMVKKGRIIPQLIYRLKDNRI